MLIISLIHLISSYASSQYIVGTTPMAWDAAEEYCISQGSNLVTITNASMNAELQTLCQANYISGTYGCWIGLYMNITTFSWEWTDGSLLNYGFNSDGSPTTSVLPWNNGEPNNSGNQNCIHLWASRSFNWDNQYCNFSAQTPICNPITPYIIGTTAMTWNEAEEYCISHGSNLVTITDASMNAELITLCRANYIPGSQGCWIGLYLNQTTLQYEWTDDSALDYGFNSDGSPTKVLPWYDGEPTAGGENCVLLWQARSYNWNDMASWNTAIPICNPASPTTAPSSSPTSNPSSNPTFHPTFDPSILPTSNPTLNPSSMSPTTISPSQNPTPAPTNNPTIDPSVKPTIDPTVHPTIHPTTAPTNYPTTDPSVEPTIDPTVDPTINPTIRPSSKPTGESIVVDIMIENTTPTPSKADGSGSVSDKLTTSTLSSGCVSLLSF